MKSRDDFSNETKEILAKRVHYFCSNPDCSNLTVGAKVDDGKVAKIGIAAHITAASPGGPRYDETFTPAQRQHINNGIWLCGNCASLIDKDQKRFSVDLLREWKEQTEKRIAQILSSQTTNYIGNRIKKGELRLVFSFASLRDFIFHAENHFPTPNLAASSITFFSYLKDLFQVTNQSELARFGNLIYESVENFFIYGDFNDATVHFFRQLPKNVEQLVAILRAKLDSCDDLTIINMWTPWLSSLQEFMDLFENHFLNYSEGYQEAEILNTKWHCDVLTPYGDQYDWKRDYWESRIPKNPVLSKTIIFKKEGIENMDAITWRLQNGLLTLGDHFRPAAGWYYKNLRPDTSNLVHLFYFSDAGMKMPNAIYRLTRIWD